MKPLVVPPAAQRDEHSIQMISAWIAEKGLHTSLKIGMWRDNGKDEESSWGIFLADTLRHIANALEEQYGFKREDAIAHMREAFDEQLDDPSTDLRGGFHAGRT